MMNKNYLFNGLRREFVPRIPTRLRRINVHCIGTLLLCVHNHFLANFILRQLHEILGPPFKICHCIANILPTKDHQLIFLKTSQMREDCEGAIFMNGRKIF